LIAYDSLLLLSYYIFDTALSFVSTPAPSLSAPEIQFILSL
jgi:hypothetical protein